MKKNIYGIILIFFLSLLPLNAQSEIIFFSNFDSDPDWTIQQPVGGANQCYSGCSNMPAGWNAYLSGMSYCTNGPGSNNFYISSIPGYPIAQSGTCRGGAGKCITFWDESCTDAFENSDGDLGKKLDRVYNEIYIRFYIKYQPGYQWQLPDIAAAHKLFHVQSYCGNGEPWSYFGNSCNMPVSVGGIHIYSGNIYYYIAYRCETNYYCQGTPSYTFDVGTDSDQVNLGQWESVLGDGNWHSMEIYFKMNTNNGATFNKDGVHKFWLDGSLKYDSTKRNGGQGIPFSDNGSSQNPRKGWNFFTIGGNNNNRWNKNCTGTQCEQWYAIDDVIVSTIILSAPSAPKALLLVK